VHIESETTIARAREDVFDYIARGERLPEYVADFAEVSQESAGEPAVGTRYRYRMAAAPPPAPSSGPSSSAPRGSPGTDPA
jgi:uncharacterized protein YndB with AHSA1/START domain